MEYDLLPIEEDEANAVDEALRNIGYDVDDRATTMQDDIDKIVNSMTKEPKSVLDFLPDPIAAKYADLSGIKS